MSNRMCFPYEESDLVLPEFVKDINDIYAKMSDDFSKEIFTSRILLCLMEDYSYMKNVILNTKGGKRLEKVMSTRGTKPQYIYGAGIRGKKMVKLFSDNNWGGFIDRNQNQDKDYNMKILSLEEFLKIYTSGMTVYVSNMAGAAEIAGNLEKQGIESNDIYILNDFDKESSENMYFQSECIGESMEKEKVFVDIGCYDGQDTLKFMQWNNDYCARIYAFEPNIENYRVCAKNLKAYPNVKLLNIALSDKEDEVNMEGVGDTSHIAVDGDIKIHTQLLDNIIKDDMVGYIKMDVEGFEEKVLKGAEKIIRNQKPYLAVSLYHKRLDVWRIPALLLKYNQNYRFYLRYYGAVNGDTVLYAVN